MSSWGEALVQHGAGALSRLPRRGSGYVPPTRGRFHGGSRRSCSPAGTRSGPQLRRHRGRRRTRGLLREPGGPSRQLNTTPRRSFDAFIKRNARLPLFRLRRALRGRSLGHNVRPGAVRGPGVHGRDLFRQRRPDDKGSSRCPAPATCSSTASRTPPLPTCPHSPLAASNPPSSPTAGISPYGTPCAARSGQNLVPLDQ